MEIFVRFEISLRSRHSSRAPHAAMSQTRSIRIETLRIAIEAMVASCQTGGENA